MARDECRRVEEGEAAGTAGRVGRELAKHAVLPRIARSTTRQLTDQLHERAPQPLPQVERAEGRKREHGEAVSRADVPRDRSPADLQRKVGDDDAEIPVAFEQLAPAGVQNFRQRRWWNNEAVDLKLGPPVDRVVAFTDVVQQLGGDPRGHVVGKPGGDDHPEDSTGALLTPFLAVLDRGGLDHTGEPAGSGVFSSASRKSSGAAPFSTSKRS